MANAIQKISLTSSRDIPFNKLVLSQSNVRRVKAGLSIEELAESIARRGLIQSLHARPVLDADGQETGMFEVPAGGRRYRALELLIKQKRLGKTAPVPCVISAHSDVLTEEVSLAENIERAPLHPLDQYRAFVAMREKGMSEEEIAAAFFVNVNVVKQRLRLASVSPALLDIYAGDGMTLEQLMAFSVSGDHERQEQVWEALRSSWSKEPYQIRRMLTETTIRASDKRALFVGSAVYEAAGGTIMRDLFESDDGGWLQDPALLDRLVTEKLEAAATEVKQEGWKWIETAVSFPYGAENGMRELDGTAIDLTAEEQATVDALRAEYEQIETEYTEADELPDEVDARLGEIETALASFDSRPLRYDPAEIARAGVFISIEADGSLSIDRGYVRPEDDIQAGTPETDSNTAACTQPGRILASTASEPDQLDEPEEDGLKPLPERLVTELTAYRTLALRDALASSSHVAMTVLLHKLVTDMFHYRGVHHCLEVSVRPCHFPAQSQDLKASLPVRSVADRHEAWANELPKDHADLWDWLVDLDEASRMALLAHCVSFGINALYEKVDRYGGGAVSPRGIEQRLEHADTVAQALGLDLVEAGWRPTVDNYLGRVTKARILEAVSQAKGEETARLIDHLKKDDMAREAERLLADSGWLPEPLRRAGADDFLAVDQAENDSDAAHLPAFLTTDLGTGDPATAVA